MVPGWCILIRVCIVFSGLCCLLSDSAAQTRCTRCTARLRLANAVPVSAQVALLDAHRRADQRLAMRRDKHAKYPAGISLHLLSESLLDAQGRAQERASRLASTLQAWED